ncbi:MAG: FtsX-like permease family protein [Deltaproteobacteria bacterium]|nr:FtsX-like permease family protein [Deltaproteobacteria bacterium]
MISVFESLVAFRYLRADKFRLHVFFASFLILTMGLGLLGADTLLTTSKSYLLPIISGIVFISGISIVFARILKKIPRVVFLSGLWLAFLSIMPLIVSLQFRVLGIPTAALSLINSYLIIISITLGALVDIFGVILIFFNVYSTISIFGVFLGTTTMVVVLSVLGGLETEQKSQILSFSPHIVITHPRNESIGNRKKVSLKINKTLEKNGIKAVAAPYLEEEVLLKSSSFDATQGILLRGIDPNFPTFNLEKHMVSGTLTNLINEKRVKWLDSGVIYGVSNSNYNQFHSSWPADSPGIIISSEQARTLGVSLGSPIDIISPRGTMSPSGPVPKMLRFRVAGIYSTRYFKYDLKYSFVSLDMAQAFSSRKNSVSGWELRLENMKKINSAADVLRKNLGSDFSVGTWETRNRALFNAMKLEKFVMFLILIVIILVAAFSITANLIMVVMDKQQEISVLKSLGATNRSISNIFMLQGVFIGMMGLLLGLATGLGICGYLAKVGIRMSENIFLFARIPVSVEPSDIVMIALTSILLTLVATMYPSHKAMKVSPIEGLYDDK